MTITLTILAVALAVLSGIAKAICDLSEEGKLKFNPENYWLKSKSWRSKYKQNNPILGAKFLGSTTVFVALTDAWHLFGLIFRLSFAISFLLAGYLIALNNWYYFLLFNYVLFAGIFHIFHTYKILRK